MLENKVYSHELVQVIFNQPYCRIYNLQEADIAKRQTASVYLKKLTDIDVLSEVKAGKEEWKQIYRQFPAEFFDLVVIDECHRGSAADDSAWREVLDYFCKAAHLSVTATPKETNEASNITYFGEPIYTYSLKQGIEDSFLAPYKVIRVVKIWNIRCPNYSALHNNI